jgi:hypothetical protein
VIVVATGANLVGLHAYSNSRDRKGDIYRNSSCTATPTATGIQAGRQRQCLQQFQKRLPTTATPAGTGFQQRQRVQEFKQRLPATATPTGRGIQAALTDDGNGKKNSDSAYRGRLCQRVREFKERLPPTATVMGRGIERAPTDDVNANRKRNSKSAPRQRQQKK